jgi:hypothetical protein
MIHVYNDSRNAVSSRTTQVISLSKNEVSNYTIEPGGNESTDYGIITRTSWKNYFAYFPYISHLFEVLEPNLLELNISGLTLTSFSSTQFNAIYWSKQLACHGYHGT